MKIYWSHNSYPEFKGVSKADRKLMWRNAYHKSLKTWTGWSGLLVCGLCAGAGRYFFGMWGLIPGNLIGFILLHMIISQVSRSYIREFIQNKESWSLFPPTSQPVKANKPDMATPNQSPD